MVQIGKRKLLSHTLVPPVGREKHVKGAVPIKSHHYHHIQINLLQKLSLTCYDAGKCTSTGEETRICNVQATQLHAPIGYSCLLAGNIQTSEHCAKAATAKTDVDPSKHKTTALFLSRFCSISPQSCIIYNSTSIETGYNTGETRSLLVVHP